MENQESTKKFYKRWWFWVGAVFVLFIVIGASGGSSKSGTSVPAPAETGSTVVAREKKTAPVPAATELQILLDLKGSGSKTTQKFTAGGDWDLNWSYDCSNFGQNGNFQVFIYDGSGQMSFRNSPVNQLGASDSGVEHYHNGGTFYFTVNSVCSWKIQVKG